MTKRFRTREFTPRPEKVETAVERGQALRNWFDVHKVSIIAFAQTTGIPRSTLSKYLAGASDIAAMPHEQAEKLIVGMGITDWESWEVLGIPEEHRTSFRTFRPPPLGHGQPLTEAIERQLDQPLVGDVLVPAGAILRIIKEAEMDGIQVVELEDGRLYAVSPVMLGSTTGKHLGRLISIHF